MVVLDVTRQLSTFLDVLINKFIIGCSCLATPADGSERWK